MACLELGLESIFCFLVRGGHDTGVANQDVKFVALTREFLSGVSHTVEVLVVHLEKFDAVGFEEGFTCFVAFLQVAYRHEDFGTCSCESASCFWADAWYVTC